MEFLVEKQSEEEAGTSATSEKAEALSMWKQSTIFPSGVVEWKSSDPGFTILQ